ncbi:MAG: transposase [Dongiaceae bacterium]
MSNRKQRRVWKPADKLRIVLESMNSDAQLAEICRREGLSPNLVYAWRKALMKSADSVFARQKPGKKGIDPKVQKLEAENARMKSVIAEVIAENLDLKKTLSD